MFENYPPYTRQVLSVMPKIPIVGDHIYTLKRLIKDDDILESMIEYYSMHHIGNISKEKKEEILKVTRLGLNLRKKQIRRISNSDIAFHVLCDTYFMIYLQFCNQETILNVLRERKEKFDKERKTYNILTEDDFNNLKKTLVINPTDKKCPICNKPFLIGDVLIKLECGHVLHKTCAKKHLCEKDRRCPKCKYRCKKEHDIIVLGDPNRITL